VDLSYAFYAPATFLGQVEAVGTYLAPGATGSYLGAPNHRAALSGTWQALRWLAVSPTLIITGPRAFLAPDGAGQELPTQVLANLFVSVTDVPVKGLSFGLGVYNLFGADYRYPQPYGSGAPADSRSAPLPGQDREVLLKVTYLWEPAGE
jgi:outer membrane receptor protein involved in Fe transport